MFPVKADLGRSRFRWDQPLVSVHHRPWASSKARRFGARRSRLFTLDSERRCRL